MNRKEDFIKIYTTYVKRPGADKLLAWLEETDFFTAPASTRFHGNYEGGHGSKSVYLIQKFMNLTEAETVAINCHMGAWDRAPGDYSLAPAYEQYPLAWLVHVADESATYIRESKI